MSATPRADAEGLKDLAPLWVELHRDHLEVAEYSDLVEDLPTPESRMAAEMSTPLKLGRRRRHGRALPGTPRVGGEMGRVEPELRL